MRIINVTLSQHRPLSEDVVNIEGPDGNYTLNGKQIESVLIDEGQMCEDCHDTGEIPMDVAVYPDEGSPRADIDTRPCHCIKGQADEK